MSDIVVVVAVVVQRIVMYIGRFQSLKSLLITESLSYSSPRNF